MASNTRAHRMTWVAWISIAIAALALLVSIDDRIGTRERLSTVARELLMGTAVVCVALALVAVTVA